MGGVGSCESTGAVREKAAPWALGKAKRKADATRKRAREREREETLAVDELEPCAKTWMAGSATFDWPAPGKMK